MFILVPQIFSFFFFLMCRLVMFSLHCERHRDERYPHPGKLFLSGLEDGGIGRKTRHVFLSAFGRALDVGIGTCFYTMI